MTTKVQKIYYASLTGKTEALVEATCLPSIKITRQNAGSIRIDEREKVIVLGSSSYGRGAPPAFLKQMLPELRRLSDRKIGLFGSGNTIYGEDYCGAIDVLEEVLKEKNEIVFKFKFEGYPTESVKRQFNEMLKKIDG